MAVKKTGISRELLIHPGETIADTLDARGLTQTELAQRAGVSAAYVSEVIAGKKNISPNFAQGLEYALGVPKSFWLSLQADYEAELLEVNEIESITEEEREARNALKDVVRYLREERRIPAKESKNQSILSLRKALHISNLADLKRLIPSGSFRISSNTRTNPYVLGAWIQLCNLDENFKSVSTRFDREETTKLIADLKNIMCKDATADIQRDLRSLMAQYGISFSIVKNFPGAPVQGYIFKRDNDVYQMAITLRGSYADIFWFSLFHEIGHIVNGDLIKTVKFLDTAGDPAKEKAADEFARNMLLSADSYKRFISDDDFSIQSIEKYSKSQNVMPFIVIGRLQKEGLISYNDYAEYKVRYKWGRSE